jgi:sulfate adenylyltransferase
MRLADGTLWPVPFVLDVTEKTVEAVAAPGMQPAGGNCIGQRLALRHPEGMLLAVLTVTDAWRPDWKAAARALGEREDAAPLALLGESQPVCLGGTVEGIELPPRHAFAALRLTPAALRQRFADLGWRRVAAYDSLGFPRRAEIDAAVGEARQAGAGLLIRVADPPRPLDDAESYARMRVHERVLRRYPRDEVVLAALPLAPCAGAEREALLRAIVHRNCGCSIYCVGGGEEALPHVLQLLEHHAREVGIDRVVVPAPAGSARAAGGTTNVADGPAEAGTTNVSEGEYPEVLEEMRRLHPPRSQQGFTVFFTGFSGSGKSTVAQALVAHLLEVGDRRVTLLDGDLVRKHLSSELTFSREHRDLNILRIGFVAGEVTRHGGVAVCAPIAPYAAVRRRVREETERVGGFVEVYVATPLEVCEARDRKGLYTKARAGLLKQFTGVDDPYEAPEHAEIVLDTTRTTPDEAAGVILAYLEREGFLGKSEE